MLTQDVDKLKQAFGDRAFSGNDVAKVLGVDATATGGAFKFMIRRGDIRKVSSGAYQFVAPVAPADHVAPIVPSAPVQQATKLVSAPAALVWIGDLYLHERLLLIADTARQEASDAVRIYTTIIEIDPATKHPRNKIINIRKAYEPREYAQVKAWLDGMAGDAPHADDTALELAAELERKLNAALEERDEYKRKLDAIRGAL